MSNSFTNYDEIVTVEEVAAMIAYKVGSDEVLWEATEHSPEPYRYMIYESGCVEHPSALGIHCYAALVVALKAVY